MQTAEFSANGERMKVVGEIRNQCVFEHWGDIQTEVILTEERILHIREDHDDDYEQYGKYIPAAIEMPNIILVDQKDQDTALFIRHVEATNINVVVKIAYAVQNTGRKSSVITMYRLGEKTKARLMKKLKMIYNDQL